MQNAMEKLFSEVKEFTEGMLVKGRIIEVRTNEVLVDIGYKSEGAISLSEFEEPDAVKVGDEIEVLLEQIEDDEWDPLESTCRHASLSIL